MRYTILACILLASFTTSLASIGFAYDKHDSKLATQLIAFTAEETFDLDLFVSPSYGKTPLLAAVVIERAGVNAVEQKAVQEGVEIVERVATESATGVLSQFTEHTIEEAVSYAMKDSKFGHLFAAKHNLEPLVEKLGGHENFIRTLLTEVNGKLPASGVFDEIPVKIGDTVVLIRGMVHDGIPKLGTVYIP